jgi:diphthine-ammonia ligase
MENNGPGVFLSWSGGKDSALAGYLAMREGMRVSGWLNTVTPDGERAWTHGQSAPVIALQAEAAGIPILQLPTSQVEYDRRFRESLIWLAAQGMAGGIFGTIDVAEHRRWAEEVCSGTGIKPYFPLWGKEQGEILNIFVAAGFRAVIVATDAAKMGEKWLGVNIDTAFLQKIRHLKGITPCGEAGEYHSYVYDGPLFKKQIEIRQSRKVLRNGYWFREILDAGLAEKCP